MPCTQAPTFDFNSASAPRLRALNCSMANFDPAKSAKNSVVLESGYLLQRQPGLNKFVAGHALAQARRDIVAVNLVKLVQSFLVQRLAVVSR